MIALTSHYSRPVIRAHLVEPPYVRQLPMTYHPANERHPMIPSVRDNVFFALLTILACVIITFVTLSNDDGPSSNVTVSEDSPLWECYNDGNRVCGDPEGVHAGKAWEAWDKGQGWQSLRVDPSKGYRVDYVGTAHHAPKVADDEAAIPAIDGLWYVFRATVTP